MIEMRVGAGELSIVSRIPGILKDMKNDIIYYRNTLIIESNKNIIALTFENYMTEMS